MQLYYLRLVYKNLHIHAIFFFNDFVLFLYTINTIYVYVGRKKTASLVLTVFKKVNYLMIFR